MKKIDFYDICVDFRGDYLLGNFFLTLNKILWLCFYFAKLSSYKIQLQIFVCDLMLFFNLNTSSLNKRLLYNLTQILRNFEEKLEKYEYCLARKDKCYYNKYIYIYIYIYID